MGSQHTQTNKNTIAAPDEAPSHHNMQTRCTPHNQAAAPALRHARDSHGQQQRPHFSSSEGTPYAGGGAPDCGADGAFGALLFSAASL